jgi:hypothetical protein
MKNTIRLNERELTRLIKRIVKENQESMGDETFDERMGGDINKVMDFGYEMLNNYAPDGPRNSGQYQRAIDQLEKEFNYTIRNLRGNIGM